MAQVNIADFKAEVPRRLSELLNEQYGEAAVNARVESGALQPYFGTTFAITPAKPGTKRTIYLWGGQYWFHWTTDVNVIRGPIPGDDNLRTYYTGDGFPKMTYSPIAIAGGGGQYPTNFYRLGIPAPTAPLSAVLTQPSGAITGATQAMPVVISSAGHGRESGQYVRITGVGGMTLLNGNTYAINVLSADTFSLIDITTGAGLDGTMYGAYTSGGTWTINGLGTPVENKESRAYVYTYVSALGEEGPPSDPSAIMDVAPGEHASLSNILTGPVSGGPYNLLTKRIYRLTTGTSGSNYQFVAEIPLAQTTFTDDLDDDELGEVLPTLINDPPPDDMIGLIALPNGVCAAFHMNEVCLSLPNLPHAWPALYRKTVNLPVVAISNFGNTIVVVTTEDAYIGNGTDPQSITFASLKIDQGCLSKRSMVRLGQAGVMYAAPLGLVRVTSQGAEVITRNYMDKRFWESLNPASIEAYYHEGMYFAFYDNGTPGCFIFDPTEGGVGLVFIDGVYATAGYSDAAGGDVLYLQVGDDIVSWDTDENAPLTYRWRSKRYDFGAQLNFGYAEIMARSYDDLTLKVYASQYGAENPTLQYAIPVEDGQAFALPDIDLMNTFQFELTGTDVVTRASFGETIFDLRA